MRLLAVLLAAAARAAGAQHGRWDGAFTVYGQGAWCGGDCTHAPPLGGKATSAATAAVCRDRCYAASSSGKCRAFGFQSGRCYMWPCFFTSCDFTECDHTSVAGNRSALPPPPPPPWPAPSPLPPPTLEGALSFALELVGTPYGWWTGGPIPLGAPAWVGHWNGTTGPVPPTAEVRSKSCFCAGLPNLMLRVVGRPVPCERCPAGKTVGAVHWCGGTGAYGRNYSGAEPFSRNVSWPRGTLLGRRYASVSDQGHVAVVLEPGLNGRILQSYSICKVEPCPIVTPGVVANFTLRQALELLPFCDFEYAVRPEHWLMLGQGRQRYSIAVSPAAILL